jgi:hypothetical protein
MFYPTASQSGLTLGRMMDDDDDDDDKCYFTPELDSWIYSNKNLPGKPCD